MTQVIQLTNEQVMLFALITKSGKLLFDSAEASEIIADSRRQLDENRKKQVNCPDFLESNSGSSKKGVKFTAQSLVEFAIKRNNLKVKCA